MILVFDNEKQGTTVRAIERALDILTIFNHTKQDMSLAEISQGVNLPKSTVHRILNTLQNYHLIEQDTITGNYRLGFQLIKLGGLALAGIDLRKKVLPEMKWLVEESGETSNLYIIRNSKRVCVEQVPGKQMVKRYAAIGETYPLYAGAAGKLLLAFLTPEEIDEYFRNHSLDPITPFSITDEQLLRADLQKIREQGYAYTANERELGAASVCGPIFNHQGEILGCLTISGPDTRFTPEKVNKYSKLVLEATDRVSKELGYIKTIEVS